MVTPSLHQIRVNDFPWKTINIKHTLICGRLNHGYMRDMCEMFTFIIQATPVVGFPLAVAITGVRLSAFQGDWPRRKSAQSSLSVSKVHLTSQDQRFQIWKSGENCGYLY